jgi:predicted Rossmann fold flavoprotein
VHNQKESVLIVGAGASGIVAAISAKRRKADVTIVDRMPLPGRKILVCGAGRCNLSNERLDETFYNETAQPLVRSVLSRFGKQAIRDFFSELGLAMYAESGRVFPVTDQASSVLRVLSIEMKRLGIVPRNDCEVTQLDVCEGGFVARAGRGAQIRCTKLILAAGAKSYPALGSNGSGFILSQRLGHSVVDPVPAAVPLVVKDPWCHLLQGQRISARIQARIDGRTAGTHEGDLLFTKYGLSGTAILDVSREVSVGLQRSGSRQVELVADMVPFMRTEALKAELLRRCSKGIPGNDMLAGILPDSFNRVYKPLLHADSVDKLVSGLKEKRFKVSGTRSWDEAEFTAGGVAVDEIECGTLKSKINPRVYFCGEIIDVDGKRGGYNLAWAWASGFVAGLTQ